MKIVLTSVSFVSGMFVSLFAYMFFYANRKNIVHHSFSIRKNEQGDKELSVFFISDIHRRKIDEHLLRKVRSYGPVDIVIVGGDLAECGVPHSRIDRNVQRLSEIAPLYFIWGNNDREVGEGTIRSIIEKHGGVILENTNVQIESHPLWGICGTDDPSSGNVNIERALKNAEQYSYTIVATHTPSLFRKVEKLCTPELMVAGHMHGGQIRFGKFALHPLGTFTEMNGKARLISNGYGTSIVPLRFGAAPECHIITIKY
ncbi:metallophosphoesterase family protein [Sporosarcina sp. ACRSL]|uniref:metallophosphoesterase n=1 Tax=Sporosarcina sp. ACRSL TaxID=2918215 RepID=UPI001EF5679C|nr:metallophosphoesterase [Sporosarcina sp. ACRSL]MCG7343010.1 metallophosphoesterase family protein [Sporosarcina sp. ACRSL]